ncbi:MAG TPA: response regulator [Anaerolineae bacterium]
MLDKTYQILYVEDQPEAVNLMRLALRKIGCEVYGAGDGILGVKMMKDLRPDLVMLDLMLPGCDGWQVREAMQADEGLRDTPVVVVSARVPLGTRNDRQPPAADAYVTKPFSLAEIRSTVSRILSLPAAVSCPS